MPLAAPLATPDDVIDRRFAELLLFNHRKSASTFSNLDGIFRKLILMITSECHHTKVHDHPNIAEPRPRMAIRLQTVITSTVHPDSDPLVQIATTISVPESVCCRDFVAVRHTRFFIRSVSLIPKTTRNPTLSRACTSRAGVSGLAYIFGYADILQYAWVFENN